MDSHFHENDAGFDSIANPLALAQDNIAANLCDPMLAGCSTTETAQGLYFPP